MKKHFLILSIFAGLFLSVFFVSCEKEETVQNTEELCPPNVDFLAENFKIKQPVWKLVDENFVDEFGIEGMLYANQSNPNETWVVTEKLQNEIGTNSTKGVIRYGTLVYEYNDAGQVTKVSCMGALSNCSVTVATGPEGVISVRIRTI